MNRKLNDQWCEAHWAPCRDPQVNGIFASVKLIELITAYKPWEDEVAKLMEEGLPFHEAGNRAMCLIPQREGKPFCCLVGEAAMALLYQQAKATGTMPK